MDDLLKNDTEATHWELSKQESIQLLEFLYPDQRILQKRGALDRSTSSYTMPQVLEYLEECGMYGHPPNPPPPSLFSFESHQMARVSTEKKEIGLKPPQGGAGKSKMLDGHPKCWLAKSKCPDLSPRATPKREHPLSHFLNTVLHSVKAACGLEYL